jgi:SAM-dependent methyltransferase
LTAIHLDLFDWIGERGKTAGAAAAHFGGHAAGWELFLNALCGMRLLRERRRTYNNTPFAMRHLDHRSALRLLPSYDALQKWSGLAPVLVSGKRPELGLPFASDGRQAERLLSGLDLDAREIAPWLMDNLPLKHCRTLLDVGGGFGSYSIAFCRRYASLKATVVEHPNVAPLTRRAVRDAKMEQRIHVAAVDILRQPLPRDFDIALLSNVLHAHGAGENRSLLAKLHRSLRPNGQLIIRDVLMRRDRTTPEWAALFSVSLFLHTPRGRCYSTNEILQWLRQAGFARVKGPFRSSPLFFDPDSVVIAKPRRTA